MREIFNEETLRKINRDFVEIWKKIEPYGELEKKLIKLIKDLEGSNNSKLVLDKVD